MKKTKSGPLSIFRRSSDTGNIPAPWVPPELPAPKAAPGRAVAAKRDRATSPPAPWMPPKLPAAVKRDRKVAKSKPWVPSEAPRNLPAAPTHEQGGPAVVIGDKDGSNTPAQTGEVVQVQPAPAQNTGGPTTIIINNQMAAPAPVIYAPWWGWWGGCPRAYCPRHAGRSCWNIFCSWW
jgi:hypothetical protein